MNNGYELPTVLHGLQCMGYRVERKAQYEYHVFVDNMLIGRIWDSKKEKFYISGKYITAYESGYHSGYNLAIAMLRVIFIEDFMSK